MRPHDAPKYSTTVVQYVFLTLSVMFLIMHTERQPLTRPQREGFSLDLAQGADREHPSRPTLNQLSCLGAGPAAADSL